MKCDWCGCEEFEEVIRVVLNIVQDEEEYCETLDEYECIDCGKTVKV